MSRPSRLAHTQARLWWIPLLVAILPAIAGEWADDLRTRRRRK